MKRLTLILLFLLSAFCTAFAGEPLASLTYSKVVTAPCLEPEILSQRLFLNMPNTSVTLYQELGSPDNKGKYSFYKPVRSGLLRHTMSVDATLYVVCERGKLTIDMYDVKVWAYCIFGDVAQRELMIQEGVDVRGRNGIYSRKSLVRLYAKLLPMIEEEFESVCRQIEDAASRPSRLEPDFLIQSK